METQLIVQSIPNQKPFNKDWTMCVLAFFFFSKRSDILKGNETLESTIKALLMESHKEVLVDLNTKFKQFYMQSETIRIPK